MAFEVDANGVLQPLGVTVLRDSRYELLPGTRDYFEEVPGRHGEVDFGAELKPRVLELHCLIESSPSEWPAKRREIAGYLNPLLGTQTLTFADEPGKVYHVRYSGKIDITKHPYAREFTIPFRMCDPFVTSSTQNELIGSGTAVNAGNAETPILLIVNGEANSPCVSVGGYSMLYYGTVPAGQSLVVDTEKYTATLNNANALPNYNGVFPVLVEGDNEIVAPSGSASIIRWYDKWI